MERDADVARCSLPARASEENVETAARARARALEEIAARVRFLPCK